VNAVLAFEPFGLQLPLPSLVLGAVVGTTYGVLAVGLILVYRTNRIINFAHGEIGAFGAAVFGTAVTRWHLPYYAALPVAFAAAAGVAVTAELAVVRRLRDAPRAMSVVATLGVGQFLLFFSAAVNPRSSAGFSYPSPPGLPEVQIGALRLTQASMGMLLLCPAVVLALTVFLRRSRYGVAMRCAAANPDAARLAGISTSRMSSLAWGLAGALSALTAILITPSSGVQLGSAFGPSLLLRALAVAAVARMESLAVALGAGVGLGMVEQVLLWNHPRSPGLVEVALYVVIMVALVLRRGLSGREAEKGGWAAVQSWRPLPGPVARRREIRMARRGLIVAGVLVGVGLPSLITNNAAVTLTAVMCFAIVGISVGVVTGLGGQLSLGQFGIAAVGAVVCIRVSSEVNLFVLAMLAAGLAGAAVSVIIGLPALRGRGLVLTVTSLGFTVVTARWLLSQSWALGAGAEAGRPVVAGVALESGRQYYQLVLGLLLLMLVLARNVRVGGLGRLLVAVRDNEDNARAFTVRAGVVKVQAFAVAGFIAGLGGAAYGYLLTRVDPSAFPVSASIDVVAMSILGGTSLVVGPLIGALYIIGLPAFLPLDSAGLAATQLGWLALILYLPGGIAQGLEPLRRRFAAWAAGRHGLEGERVEATDTATGVAGWAPAAPSERRCPHGAVLLQATDLRKHFGGVAAVDGVDIEVRAGEILGLIGPNGAGKTTTFELLSGFTRADTGRVVFDGHDVSHLGPESRGRRGLIRSFQDAALFPTMTVLEVLCLAFERAEPTGFLTSTLGLRGAERRKEEAARGLLAAMGLDHLRQRQVQELSTGTRRITEIACLVALRPSLLLLDEPSSGIAQRETEALGELLLRLRKDLDLTMVLIEHDIPMVMGLSDRIVVMDAGVVISSGVPAAVRADPRVVEAYLGGSLAGTEPVELRERPGLTATDRP
jgi:ABC-type branched-subunit amino acid transport system ATPase component/ABC-type branched-subunit amino acid transport system permease subunit